MRGFFEHQYLSFKKDHVRNLISLARADGEFHEKEKDFILEMGKRYGLKDRQIIKLIEEKEVKELRVPQSHEAKMDQLYDLLQLIYADGKVDDHEVDFLEQTVRRFGYEVDMATWLIELFATEEVVTEMEWKEAKKEAEEQFKL